MKIFLSFWRIYDKIYKTILFFYYKCMKNLNICGGLFMEKYYSSRNVNDKVSFSTGVTRGLSPNGGLYVPDSFASINIFDEKYLKMSYQELAVDILSNFLDGYTKEEVQNFVSEAYGELAFSSSAPSWTGVIDSLARRGNSTVTISGEAYWAGHQFHDLYFYADTTIGGAFGLLATGHPTWFELNDTQDTISYSATFDLQTRDSLTLEFGLFIDRDLNGSFNSGDSLGAWNNGQGNFTPFTVYRGTTEEDRNITVRLRRP